METTVLSKMLVPLDLDKDNRGVISFVKYINSMDKGACCQITLLYALSSGFLGERLANIDFRAKELADSSFIKGLRDNHVKNDILPKMEAIKQELIEFGIPADSISVLLEDGEPVDVIAHAVETGGYNGLVLQRSCTSPLHDAIVGSVTAGLLHRNLPCPFYIVGAKLWKKIAHTGRLLVAVDGSPYADKAIDQAVDVASLMGDGFEKLYLCHISELMRKIRGDLVFDLDKLKVEGDAILDKARKRAEEQGIAGEKIAELHGIGKADDVIAKMCSEHDIDILFLGRKGMSALEEVLMGSVSRSIINKCVEATIALVS